ncbi:MAG: chemotaxis protein CheW [Deltaproteobacteria bacterium]|nr:chemotaxis protein CheW [Deltaproteobacteria bacterium]
MDDITREFLVESHENLDSMDRDFVELEKNPSKEILGGIFRVIHTIKGTCGFLGFPKLESVTHVGENLLSRLRDGTLQVSPAITDALLAMVDAVREMLAQIETVGNDGVRDYSVLIETLSAFQAAPALEGTGAGASEDSDVLAIPPESKFGEILVRRGQISRADLDSALAQQALGDPRRVGEILVEQGSVQPSEVLEALKEQGGIKAGVMDRTVRVDVGLLDKLMNLVGELVLARNQILQFANSKDNASVLEATQRLNLITAELREGVMKSRMQPIGNIWNKLPRLVRDLAFSCNKQVRLEMEGKETELDKTIIEAIKDPLTHILRNSLDHGIESPEKRIERGKPAEGKILLRAFHEGGRVNIEIADDGAGINPESIRERALHRGLITFEQSTRLSEREILNLIFLPGFSTVEAVTNISGRGVGMDVVKTNIEKISGSVDVQSRWGEGTVLKMKIPLTLAIIPALLVTSGGGRYAIPQVNLLELIRLRGDQGHLGIEMVQGAPVYRLRGDLLPLVFLSQELMPAEVRRDSSDGAQSHVVVLQADGRRFGLVVDRIGDTEDIVVRPLGKHFKGTSTFSGATILGDGKIALILDIVGLSLKANVLSEARSHATTDRLTSTTELSSERQALLISRSGDHARVGIPLYRISRLEEFPVSAIEKSDGCEVVQYRGEIMPLLHIPRGQPDISVRPKLHRESVQVVVYRCREGCVGLIVDQIIDIVEEDVDMKPARQNGIILGSAIVQGRITDILDVQAILQSASLSYVAI